MNQHGLKKFNNNHLEEEILKKSQQREKKQKKKMKVSGKKAFGLQKILEKKSKEK